MKAVRYVPIGEKEPILRWAPGFAYRLSFEFGRLCEDARFFDPDCHWWSFFANSKRTEGLALVIAMRIVLPGVADKMPAEAAFEVTTDHPIPTIGRHQTYRRLASEILADADGRREIEAMFRQAFGGMVASIRADSMIH